VKQGKGLFASEQKHSKAESSSAGRGADSNDEENCEGIDGEEEEEEKTLPATQEKEEESSFDLEKRTKIMISPQHSMGDGYARRKCDNCGDVKATRDADKGVLPTLCTGCETRKGPFASEQKHSDSEERTATTRRTSRGSTGRKRRKKILFQQLRKKEEESSFDLEKRTKFMIRPQRSMGDGYARRRECTTFCKHKVVENNYGCLQNVVRKQFLWQRSGQRRQGEPRGDRRGGRGGRKYSSSN
jgi:hypothetical protein